MNKILAIFLILAVILTGCTAEDIDNIELSGSTLTIGFGDYCLNVISPASPIPSEVKLPEGEPALERAPSLSGLKFRYYAGDGAKFYWSRTGEIRFDYTIDLPESAKNVVITDFHNGNSCEANVTLEADADGNLANFGCVINTYFMLPQQISIDVIEASNG